MPNYDFNCQSCEHAFEQNVPFEQRDEPLECPKCGKKTVSRGVSAVKMAYSSGKTNLSRAGSGWNDVLGKVKKGSGRSSTIRTR